MFAPTIDNLVDIAALDGSELRAYLMELGRDRARLDAAEAAAIAELDQRAAYLHDGAVNAKAWLAHQTGVLRTTAGSRVRLAKCLRRMPSMAAALADGLVTDGHARAMARCLTPRTLEAFARDEEVLTGAATTLDADGFDLVVTRWLFLNDPDGLDPDRGRDSALHASPLLGGRTRIDGELDLEDSVEFLAELEAIYDELWHADQAADDSDPLKHRSPAERYAAALVEMARRSSAAGDRDAGDGDAGDGDAGDGDADGCSAGDRDADGRTAGGGDADSGAQRARAPRRPQLIAMADLEAIKGDLTGLSLFENGEPLPQEILQRWLCDSAIGRVIMAGASMPIDLGRITYTTSAGQRRALIARDRGCIVPGCKRKPRWCEAHHVVPFPDGPTDLKNLVLLCKRHHKQVHQRIIVLAWSPPTERWIVTRPDGTRLKERPPP